MDRYEIAAGRGDQPIAYRFRASNSSDAIYKYMLSCVKDDVMLDMSTLKESAVEEAAIKLCREKAVPYVVATDKEADLLPLVHGYKMIFTKEKLPEKYRAIVCGVGVDPSHFGPSMEIILAIINKGVDTDGKM